MGGMFNTDYVSIFKFAGIICYHYAFRLDPVHQRFKLLPVFAGIAVPVLVEPEQINLSIAGQ